MCLDTAHLPALYLLFHFVSYQAPVYPGLPGHFPSCQLYYSLPDQSREILFGKSFQYIFMDINRVVPDSGMRAELYRFNRRIDDDDVHRGDQLINRNSLPVSEKVHSFVIPYTADSAAYLDHFLCPSHMPRRQPEIAVNHPSFARFRSGTDHIVDIALCIKGSITCPRTGFCEF